MLKIRSRIKDTEYAKFSFFRPFLLLAPDVSAGRTASEIWYTSQELYPAGIFVITTTALRSHSPGDEN
jgi:hypothetical protein